jgi:hypothetical protein
MKPSAFQLFCMYHLGLSPEFEPRFYNLNSVARHFGVLPESVQQWLLEYHIAPEMFPRVSFNVAKAHGEAQDLAMRGEREAAHQFARKAFREYIDSLGAYSEKNYFGDVNYDDIWGDGTGSEDLVPDLRPRVRRDGGNRDGAA